MRHSSHNTCSLCVPLIQDRFFRDRELAQLVERHPYKVDVAGSNPVLPTI